MKMTGNSELLMIKKKTTEIERPSYQKVALQYAQDLKGDLS